MLYLISLGAGVLVGIIYSLINFRSPAPPLVALVGLLGMLAGEQASLWASGVWRVRLSQSPGVQRTCLACCRAAIPTRPQRFPENRS
jgi:XapX domain-containing protein